MGGISDVLDKVMKFKREKVFCTKSGRLGGGGGEGKEGMAEGAFSYGR